MSLIPTNGDRSVPFSGVSEDWIHGLPFIQSVIDMQAYWVWRGVGGLLMFLSHVVFAWNVWRICHGPVLEAAPRAARDTE